MKQLAQYQDGRLELQEVSGPTAPPGGVLVRVTHSVISIGTEKMKVEQARMNLLQKARARPDQVRKVLDTARNLGWRNALEKVRNRLESPSPLGYSAAGVVTAVDAANDRFRVGDRVAVGGAECAFHAEYVAIPDLLAAPVPEGVPSWQAAYTTLCSIALQAIRQTEPRLGDRVLVIGQGLVGLLITNLMRLSGARVMAVDVLPSRRALCHTLGAERVVILGEQSLADEVRLWTGGAGVDSAVVCTASPTNGPIDQAADALRDRGRVVIVGITHVELSWRIFTEKEIDVRFSRSYGPGRYDPAYEWGGQDYPIGYVRWTEQRNFQACLQLMARGEIQLEALTTRRTPFNEALGVYATLAKPGGSEVGIVLCYDAPPATSPSETSSRGDDGRGTTDATPENQSQQATGFGDPQAAPAQSAMPARRAATGVAPRGGLEPGASRAGAARVSRPVTGLDVIGAGNFARTMLLPHVKGRLRLGTVVNQTALSAEHVRTKFGFEHSGTDAGAVLGADGSGSRAVMIATRHHLHAPLVEGALAAGRDVFVEKPLCLTREELVRLDTVMERGTGSVMVGFNRRFAPASVALKAALGRSAGPKVASFRVMPGRLEPTHWYANHRESGGRVLGEACHFLDFFCFLFEAAPVRVSAQTIGPIGERLPFPDGVTAQVEFADGSSGQLIYTAEGDAQYPKEVLTVYGAGLVAEVTNFQELVLYRGRERHKSAHAGKGHAEEMKAWADYLAGLRDHPLPYAEARRSMLLTFAVLDSIREGRSVAVSR